MLTSQLRFSLRQQGERGQGSGRTKDVALEGPSPGPERNFGE